MTTQSMHDWLMRHAALASDERDELLNDIETMRQYGAIADTRRHAWRIAAERNSDY